MRVDLVTGDPDVAERPRQEIGVDELEERGLEPRGDVRRLVAEIWQRNSEFGDAGVFGVSVDDGDEGGEVEDLFALGLLDDLDEPVDREVGLAGVVQGRCGRPR